MIDQKRAIAHKDYIKMYRQNGDECLKPYLNKTNNRDYFRCSVNGIKKHLPVYNLVWLAHGNKLTDGKTVDHIDRDSRNNSIKNLRLATRAEQRLNAGNAKTTPELREWIRDQFNKGLKSIRGMARELGLCRETVQDIIHMKYKLDIQLEGQK